MNGRRLSRIAPCLLVLLSLAVACGGPAPSPTPTAQPAATQAPPTPAQPPTATPAPTLSPNVNPLTGERVADPQVLQHRPILVRYGHDRIARPPSGLSSADLVFEELAEGNFVTRITGAYLSSLPEMVGPIRSARPAVIDMVQQLDGVLAYAGASIGTTQLLNQQSFAQYAHGGHGGDLFYRTAAKPSPHNLYLKLPALRELMAAEGVDGPAQLGGLAFSLSAPAGSPATRVHIPYPGQAPVDYSYDAATGTYLRFVEGVPHTDGLNGEQLAPENVIVLYAEHKDSSIVEDTLGNVAILIKLVGSGRAQVFRDGVMVEGTWQRNEAGQLTRYKDAAGHDIALKPGQSWVEIVPLQYQIDVQ